MTNKRKILYIITKSNWGGAQRYVFDLAKSLKDECEITVASGGNGILFDKLKSEGIKTISIPYLERDIKIWNEPKVILEMFKIIKNEKPDVIHLNSPKAGLLGGVAGRLYNFTNRQKTRIIQTVHGFPFIEPRSFIWKLIMKLASYISLLLSQKNILVSKRDMHFLKQMPFTKNKSVYIPNGISSIDFIQKEEAREKLLGYKFEGILLGTIAEMNHNKGLEYLIKSLSYLKDENIKSVIIGEGEKRQTLEELKSKENVDIKFAGLIPEASKYLKAFDIFILPSLKEGLPYVLIEAGFAELPVISTTVGGIPYLIESGLDGTLVPSKDPRALAVAIELYLQDEHLRKGHAKKLQEKVQEQFSLEKMVERTEQTYNL